jgi:hypothetical protein
MVPQFQRSRRQTLLLQVAEGAKGDTDLTARGAAAPGAAALLYSRQKGGARRSNSDSYQIFSALAVSALPGFSAVQNPILAMMG